MLLRKFIALAAIAYVCGVTSTHATQNNSAAVDAYRSYYNALKRARSFSEIDPYMAQSARARRNQEISARIPPAYDNPEGRKVVESSILRIMSAWAERQSIFSIMHADSGRDAAGQPQVVLAVAVRDRQTQQSNVMYPLMVYEQSAWKYAGDRPPGGQ